MVDTLPLVSTMTPAYNKASYLDETIQSVLEQDYPRIECIVLDDGSTDNTRQVLEKYSGRIVWESHLVSGSLGQSIADSALVTAGMRRLMRAAA